MTTIRKPIKKEDMPQLKASPTLLVVAHAGDKALGAFSLPHHLVPQTQRTTVHPVLLCGTVQDWGFLSADGDETKFYTQWQGR
jgi:hypothetical protein